MRRKILSALSLLTLLLFLFPAALTRYAAAVEQGTLTITDRSYQSGVLSLTAQLSGLTPEGQLAVVVFTENNEFKNCVFYPAKDSVKVQVSAGSTDTVKTAWLDDSQRFLATPDILRMEQSGTVGNESFTTDLQKLISSFNPSGGKESVSEDAPYYLQRLIVKCDRLPSLTGYQATVLAGPDNLYILSFATPSQAEKCAEYIRTQPMVKYVEPDRTLTIDSDTVAESAAYLQDSGSHRSWGVKATGVGAYAEDLRTRSLNRQVVVAVLDSGIEADHAFLSGRLLPASNLSPENDTEDLLGHGTHVAGIIADCTQGLDVKILPIKIMNRFGSFTTLSLIGGIYEAAAKGANVINLSLSAPATEEYRSIEDAVRYAVSKNITVVAAAGNQGGDTSRRTPACLEDCITVTAVKQDETRFEHSNYGDAVDLTAPGVSINSSVPGGNYGDMSGTSMAAPHVSAAAALLLYERGTTLTPTQINKSLCNAARHLKNQTGWQSDFGSGMLDLTSFIKKTQVSITYAPNGGTGSMSVQTVNAGETASLTKNAFTRNGCQFTGWNTKADGTGTSYTNQASINIRESLTLYAQWNQTAGAYAILYSDGELVFQTTDTPTAGRTVTKVYPVQTSAGGSAEYAAWYEYREAIKKVTFAEKIQPVSTAFWFYGCGSLTTINGMDKLDTSKVTDMTQMFADCDALTELDLTAFRTENVTNMTGMFLGCTALKAILVSDKFTTGAVTSSRDMFKDCTSLSGGRGTGYDSSHTDKSYARIDGGTSAPGYFTDPNAPMPSDKIYAVLYDDGELVFQNGDRTESGRTVTGVYEVKDHYSGYNVETKETDYPVWRERRNMITAVRIAEKIRPTSTAVWFDYLENLQEIRDIENLDTSNVTDMSHMFGWCSSLTSLDVSNFDTSNVTDMNYMFCRCSNLTSLDVSGFDTSNVTNMNAMFDECRSLTSLDLSGFDTSQVTSMYYMFAECRSLTSLDLSGFDTSQVTDMHNMFYRCSGLTSLDLSSFDTSKVTGMSGMFQVCSGLTSLDLSSFDTSEVWRMNEMFYGCSKLQTIFASVKFVTSKIGSGDDDYMFSGCTSLVGGKGTTYSNSRSLGKKSARIDGGPSSPGFFTEKSEKEWQFQCGENVTGLLKDGVFKLSGTGAMYNYESVEETPWTSVRDEIYSIQFEDGVTSVGNSAFYGSSNLSSIVFPSRMEDIGLSSFGNCTALTELTFAGNMNHIGISAFENCTNLESLTISGTVNSIGLSTFANCTKLESLTISGTVNSIGISAFANCTKLKKLTITGMVNSVGVSAFGNCSSLNEIYLPTEINSIGMSAFDGCAKPSDLYYAGTSSQWQNVSVGLNAIPTYVEIHFEA